MSRPLPCLTCISGCLLFLAVEILKCYFQNVSEENRLRSETECRTMLQLGGRHNPLRADFGKTGLRQTMLLHEEAKHLPSTTIRDGMMPLFIRMDESAQGIQQFI